MRVAVITANLGNDRFAVNVEQEVRDGLDVSYFRLTSKDIPHRHNAMSHRLQAKIPKMLGGEMFPGYDYYIWKDATISFINSDAIAWLVCNCAGSDMAVFKHPERDSIVAEMEFIEWKMLEGDPYLCNRYGGEPLREQVNHYLADKDFVDDKLFACGVFIYHRRIVESAFMNTWFYECARWSVQDQLSLPYIVSNIQPDLKIIDKNIFGNEYFQYQSFMRSII